jgi:hypothetical protein
MRAKTVLRLWAAGFVGAALTQGLWPRRFADRTAWGYNAGWQREIAMWNVGTLAALAAVQTAEDAVQRRVACAYAFLMVLFGANHVGAGLQSRRSWGHWIGAGANGAGLLTALPLLAARAREQ